MLVRKARRGAKKGAVIGAIVSLLPIIAALASSPLGIGLAAAVLFLVTFTVTGAAIGWSVGGALPEMLPHYRRDHMKLRDSAGHLRRNLRRMNWTRPSLERIEDVLEKDAELRHQATVLKKTVAKFAPVSLRDRISAGKMIIRETVHGADTAQLNKLEWTLKAYRSKLIRELNELAERRYNTRDDLFRDRIDEQYRIKYEEWQSFERTEQRVARIERDLIRIRTRFETALMRSTSLAHVELPTVARGDNLFGEEFLSDLNDELTSFDRALREMSTEPVQTDQQGDDSVPLFNRPGGSS